MQRLVPRVVVVGAGFGGLQCARKLRGEPVDVLLIDAQNYHLFTPLLYQVASCLLNPGEIAAPLRKTFRGARNVHVRRGLVIEVDLDARRLTLDDGAHIDFDHLVLAAGSRTNFYGNDELARHTLGLKDLGEALQLRNHVLDCLERAAVTDDAAERRRRLTFCIVGGGPTGVEYAGALAELVRLVLPTEYPELLPADVRIVLLEGGDRLLPAFRKRLSAYALRELSRRGVDVRLNALVATATHEVVETRDGDRIETASMIWTAGVQPSELTRSLGVPHGKSGRIEVDERLRVPGFEHVYAIGDAALTAGQEGSRASDDVAAGDAGRPLRRSPDPRPDAEAAIPLRRQGHAGDDRPNCGRRPGRALPVHGLHRLDRLAGRSPLLPDRVREPGGGDAALVLVLPALRPADPGGDLGSAAP